MKSIFRRMIEYLRKHVMNPVDLRGEGLEIYLLKTFLVQFGSETRAAIIDPVTRFFFCFCFFFLFFVFVIVFVCVFLF